MRKAILMVILMAWTGAACSTMSGNSTSSAPPADEGKKTMVEVNSRPISDAEFADSNEVLGPELPEHMKTTTLDANSAWEKEEPAKEAAVEAPKEESQPSADSSSGDSGQESMATPVAAEPRPEGQDLDPSQATDNANLFQNTTAGFSIQKPESWNFLSAQVVAANRENIRLQDENMEKLIREKASAPLVAMAKYPEPYDDLNPGVQVMVRPLGQLASTPATDILKMTSVQLQNAFADYSVVEDVHETEVDGMKAAAMKIKYTVANAEGRQFPTLTRMWLIPRGEYMFTVGMSGPQEGPNMAEEDFQQILDSIKIEKR